MLGGTSPKNYITHNVQCKKWVILNFSFMMSYFTHFVHVRKGVIGRWTRKCSRWDNCRSFRGRDLGRIYSGAPEMKIICHGPLGVMDSNISIRSLPSEEYGVGRERELKLRGITMGL